MAHINHVLLGSRSRCELLITAKAELAELNSLCDVGKDTLKVGQTLDVENGKVVMPPHMVQIFLYSIGLLIAEKANSEGLERRFLWNGLFGKIRILVDSQWLIVYGAIDVTQEVRRLSPDRLENTAHSLIWVACKVGFRTLFVFFRAFVLI